MVRIKGMLLIYNHTFLAMLFCLVSNQSSSECPTKLFLDQLDVGVTF